MATSGSQIKVIHQALLAAYSRDELRQWLRTCMDESFEALAPDKEFSAQLFALLEWADRQERLRELVRCARENNPGNGALYQVWTQFFAATTAEPPPPDADIFLSYSRHDTALMHRLRAALLNAGFTVWTDEGLTPGTPSWQDRIEQAVDATRGMVVILSPRAKASKWVRVEIELAQEAGHAVFPVLAAGDTKRSAVPLSLWEVQYADARADFGAVVDVALLPALRQHFGRPAAASVPRSDAGDSARIVVAAPGPQREIAETSRAPVNFDWVTIPAGEFLMGSDKSKDRQARDDELPQQRLVLPAYRIARVPVTNEQYRVFVQVTNHSPPSHWQDGRIPNGKELHPVVRVSWRDAVAFCTWAGVRLPSEAEWEKAARGTDGRIWPWGNDEPTREHCNFANQVGDTTPVGQFPKGASPYGVLEMAGNVWEWTGSLYRPYPYDPADGREDSHSDGGRTLRGGSFNLNADRVRCAARFRDFPYVRNGYFGFRVVSPGS